MGRRRWSPWLLLQLLGQFLLIVNQADSSPANKTIRIGYLLDTKARAGAINVAIEKAQNEGLLRDYNFRYKPIQVTTTSWCMHNSTRAVTTKS